MEVQSQPNFDDWYEIKEEKLDPNVCKSFKTHFYDNETEEFIIGACNISYFKHFFDSTISIFLLPFVSTTSRNAILNRGNMFVASSSLFAEMISYCQNTKTLLDIGAGSGNVTMKLSSQFDKVFATETSPSMCDRLQAKGYTVLQADNWTCYEFDVISCLNVLDRCHDPLKLLEEIYKVLSKKGGTCIIALVLPYHGSVEEGNVWSTQRGSLPIRGKGFEEQLSSLVVEVLEPLGFELNMATRVPYLCTGDLHASYYCLTDCLLSLNVRPCNDP